MLFIDINERPPLTLYMDELRKLVVEKKLRYTEQREKILIALHGLSKPVTVSQLTQVVNNKNIKYIGYPTTVRHINYFRKINWLITVNKVHKQYILKKDIF